MTIAEIIEQLKALPADAKVLVCVMDKAAYSASSSQIEYDVLEADVLTREGLGEVIKQNGKEPTRENVDKVLEVCDDGLMYLSDSLAEHCYDVLPIFFEEGIDSL